MKEIIMILAALMCQLSVLGQTTDTILDSRDGNKYVVVRIGDQWWMAENLRYNPGSGVSQWNEVARFTKIFGYFYTYEIAIKACPAGWHLPTDDEWQAMINYLGGKDVAGGKLKSKENWPATNVGATNESGFSAVSSGIQDLDGTFVAQGEIANYWSATPFLEDAARIWAMDYSCEKTGYGYYKKQTHVPVRCVKDQTIEVK